MRNYSIENKAGIAPTKRSFGDQTADGFTLVEILVVMVIIGLMGGMVLVAVQGVTNSARASRTRAIITACDNAIQEQYESYKYRPYPVVSPNFSVTPAPGTIGGGGGEIVLGYEILATEAARVRLQMTRDLQRMEMPDRVSDVWTSGAINTPASLKAASDFVAEDSSGALLRTRNNKAQRKPVNVSWYSGGSVPGRLQSYFDRTSSSWSTTHQGAECLYLIMATTFVAGSPAISSIPESNIADTDSDGVPEILDGWGIPLGFVRWPTGISGDVEGINQSIPDDFDPFRSDFGFNSSANKPWSVRPLIVSAGPDGEFGIALSPTVVAPTASAGADDEIDYSSMDWQISTAWMGDEHDGRGSGTWNWVDPYLRYYSRDTSKTYVFPGGDLPDSYEADASEFRVDNITNFALEATQ